MSTGVTRSRRINIHIPFLTLTEASEEAAGGDGPALESVPSSPLIVWAGNKSYESMKSTVPAQLALEALGSFDKPCSKSIVQW
jgi:hypothetical protein